MMKEYSQREKWRSNYLILYFLFFKILFIFRERGRKGESKGEKHQCVVASCMPSTRNLARNPGVHPDRELNQQLFGSQAGTQSTGPPARTELFNSYNN